MKKRILAWIVALCVAVSLLPPVALAADEAGTADELKRAIEEAPTDGTPVTITLTADIADMTSSQISTIDEGQTIILDMAGHSITAASDFIGRPFINYGTFTIDGDGVIDVTAAGEDGWGPVNNYGTLTVESGTFLTVEDTGTNATWNRSGGCAYFNGGTFVGGASTIATEAGAYTEINGGNYESILYPTIENRGEMLITGGTFRNTSCSACDRRWGYTIRSGESSDTAYLKIQGADADSVQVTGVQGALSVIGGTADIYNGEYETVACREHGSASAFHAGYFTGESYVTRTNIYGGTFRACSRNALQVGNGNPAPDSGAGEDSVVMIYGGTFIGGGADKTAIVVEREDYAIGAARIYGGTFSSDVSIYLDDGLVQNAGGTVGTPDEVAVARIGERKYLSLSDAIADAGSGDTVTLIDACVLDDTVTVDEDLTLDLNGHVVTNALKEVPQAETDSRYLGRMIRVTNGAGLTVDGTAPGSGMTIAEDANTVGFIGVDTGSTLTLNGGTYTGDTASYWYMKPGYPGSYVFLFETDSSEDYNSLATKVTLKNLTAESNNSVLNGDTIWGDLTVDVTGGTYTSVSDFLFHVDTMKLCPVNFTDVEATVEGAKPIAEMSGAAGVFENCTFIEKELNANQFSDSAIFVGYNGTATIKSGTYQAARTALYIGSSGGAIDVTGGTFIGGSYAAQATVASTYETPATIRISGGNFAGEFRAASVTMENGEVIPASIIISGGNFTADPSAYLTADKAAVESTVPGYHYTVAERTANAAQVVPAVPEVTEPRLPEDASEEEEALAGAIQSALTGAASAPGISTEVLDAAAKTEANKNAVTVQDGKDELERAEVDTAGQTVTIVLQPYMEIAITDVSAQGEEKSLTLDISPMYRTVATTADLAEGDEIVLKAEDGKTVNATQIGEPRDLTVTKPVTVTIPLPADFADDGPLYIKHVKDDGRIFYYTGAVESDVLTFSNPNGFSTFTTLCTNAAAAETDGVGYDSLQDAVDNVADGGTITLLKDGLFATVSRPVSFRIVSGGGQSHSADISAGSGYRLTVSGNTYTVTAEPSAPAAPGISGDSGYAITLPVSSGIQGGSISVSPRRAEKGDTVTITVSPDEGYVLEALTVTGRDGGTVTLDRESDSRYTFTMPAGAVAVEVSFAEADSPAERTFADVPANYWAYDEIAWAYENGYMNGTSATAFNPGGTVTRQQVWMILARMSGADPADMAAARAWAVANGISDGTDPGGAVTRQQLAALLYRYAVQNGMAAVTMEENLSGYPDASSVSGYAVQALNWAVGQGIIGGTTQGTLNPTGTATRAQLAVMLWRWLASPL